MLVKSNIILDFDKEILLSVVDLLMGDLEFNSVSLEVDLRGF